MLFGQIRWGEAVNLPGNTAIHRAMRNKSVGVPACGTPVAANMVFVMFDCEEVALHQRCTKPACKFKKES